MIICFTTSCRKAKYGGETCTENCLVINGTIMQGATNPQPMPDLELRIYASRTTGIGKSTRLMLQTTTDINGVYSLSFDASSYVDDYNKHYFELEFKNAAYKSQNITSEDNHLEYFSDITVDSLDNPIQRDYTIIRK